LDSIRSVTINNWLHQFGQRLLRIFPRRLSIVSAAQLIKRERSESTELILHGRLAFSSNRWDVER